MRGGVILLLLGIIMAYLAVSGKYACFTLFAKCIAGSGKCACEDNTTAQTASLSIGGNVASVGISLPKLPTLPPIISNIYG